jgi:adenylate cyclase
MVELPSAIKNAIFKIVFAERSIAFLKVDGSGSVMSIGGEKELFGLEKLEVGAMVEDHFDFLVGLLDCATLPIELPIMEMPSGIPADVHIFIDGGDIWILFVHATEKKQQRQLFRQNVNNLSLSRHRQSRILNQYLGKEVAKRLELGLENVESSGERRNLTVMFADIRGFTSYSEKSKPEDIFAALNIYLGTMIPVVLEERGLLDKIIGDEVMALSACYRKIPIVPIRHFAQRFEC